MENREPEGHVEYLAFLELRRLAFGTTSASTRNVVPVVTPDPMDDIIRQLKEELVKLRSTYKVWLVLAKSPLMDMAKGQLVAIAHIIRNKSCMIAAIHYAKNVIQFRV
ncbi:hypothetical protein RJT34_10361 [Clitoria ternatea]|uniref:Uncharacterized protein n=1 Tax=Clitoria ternatea TaxID=43366 RepID=A0AAN9PTS2_CLITE